MKKLSIAFSILLSTLAVQPAAYADTEAGKMLLASMTKSADELNISVEQYKYALDQFNRLMSDPSIFKGKKLSEIDEFVNYSNYSKSKVIEILNSQKAQLASFYGIPVEILAKFESKASDGYYWTKKQMVIGKSSIVLQRNDDEEEEEEVITVTCDDPYCRGEDADFDVQFGIYNEAVSAGIGQYQTFEVRFVGSNGGTKKVQTWKYNHFSGAWKHRDGAPCRSCYIP